MPAKKATPKAHRKDQSKPFAKTPFTGFVRRFVRGIWFFPALLTLVLLSLTALQISGSSMGIYHKLFYGDAAKDPALIANEPRGIRADEWIVNTQMTMAQDANDYHRINHNIGNGEDMSLMIDAPYKDWSVLFKPHNLAFFVLPFDNAFAFRWWVMGYLLILSAYFFTLALLPGKRLLASLIGLGLFFSPLVQWWYLYGTLGTLFYCLFAGAFLVHLLQAKSRIQSWLWGSLLAYVLTCFIFLLYPPFQIPCGLALAAFGIGYLAETSRKIPRPIIWQKIGIIGVAVVVAGLLSAAFFIDRKEVISTVRNTAYPGQRIIESGGYNPAHLFSSHLSILHTRDARAAKHAIPENGITNQSESANFMSLLPFLFLPGVYLLIYGYRKGKGIDWPLLLTSTLYLILLVRLFVPLFEPLFKLGLLHIVPHNRLLIGLGLLGIIHLVLVMRNLSRLKAFPAAPYFIYGYVGFVLIVQLALGFYALDRFPGFIRIREVILLSVPLTAAVFLVLRRRFVWAAAVLLLFSAASTWAVNPLYRGSEVITKTPLSQAIQTIAQKDDGRWVTESSYLENFALINGAPSLTGVYAYPQLDLWKDTGAPEDTYNRYAHTNAVLDRDINKTIPTKLELAGGDRFGIVTEPCSAFLQKHKVRYILAEVPIQDSCVRLIEEVPYPSHPYYIYRLEFNN